jgi:hypothetical protein
VPVNIAVLVSSNWRTSKTIRSKTQSPTTDGKFGLDLFFTRCGVITLSATSVGKLADAWGDETKNWAGKTAKVYAGDIPFGADFKRGVVVEPVSPAVKLNPDGTVAIDFEDEAPPVKSAKKAAPSDKTKVKAKQQPAADFNDEIPY